MKRRSKSGGESPAALFFTNGGLLGRHSHRMGLARRQTAPLDGAARDSLSVRRHGIKPSHYAASFALILHHFDRGHKTAREKGGKVHNKFKKKAIDS